ncbi:MULTISPECIES: hypothetical protein [Stenotrophomonas]|uniref:hypothetical protein n=1 Tax=Stenotrophomonas maltophilia group TaxID=995085 RepID=UPI0021C9A86E|nr:MULTISPECIES: hypothetical protein [Stenotrophomonas]MCU1136874.1 hypothetical protein [Stenotrophomonas maltophilia]MEC4339800.1 hypothetical protein [Stenotrophomonas pavanii]
MNTIKGIKALRVTFSRLPLATLPVAAIAPSLLMLLTGQLNVLFVSAWGAVILYLAFENAIDHDAGTAGADTVGMTIVHQAALVAWSLGLTLVSFKVIRLIQDSDATDASVASAFLFGWVLASAGRIAFVSYKGIEFSPYEMGDTTVNNHSEKTSA